MSVFGKVNISNRTTAVVRSHISWYAIKISLFHSPSKQGTGWFHAFSTRLITFSILAFYLVISCFSTFFFTIPKEEERSIKAATYSTFCITWLILIFIWFLIRIRLRGGLYVEHQIIKRYKHRYLSWTYIVYVWLKHSTSKPQRKKFICIP